MPAEPSSRQAKSPSSPFPEYERAVSDLQWTVVNELMVRNDPVLAKIAQAAVDEIPSTPTQPAGGALGAYQPLGVEISRSTTLEPRRSWRSCPTCAGSS